jgi:two-component system cell cycle sensor histidine kinase/response regulator CckA
LIYFKTKSDTGLKVEQTMAVILLVEDEEQVRVLADSFLQVEGNKTLSAGTVQQALALIEGDETIDLLFVDLKIQDDVEGGLKLAKKAVEARPNLKVLYTSGQAVTDGMMALFEEKSAFLPKPYTVEQLATTLLAKFSIGSCSKKSGE